MSETTSQVARSYIRELEAALHGVSDEVSREILTGVQEELSGLDAAAAAARIEELGDPAFIAAEARAEVGAVAFPRTSNRRWYGILVSLLVALGGFVIPVLGWIVGLVLMWFSGLWFSWEKWVATLVAPGILLLVGVISWISSQLGGGLVWWHVAVLSLVVNVPAGFWLLWRLHSSPRPHREAPAT